MALVVDTIRKLVSDTDDVSPILEDSAYQAIIDLGETNAYRAAAVACRQLSANFAAKVDVTAGPVKVANSQKAESYLALAVQYDTLANKGLGEDPNVEAAVGFLGIALTGVSISEMASVASDTDRPSSSFTRDLHSNVEDDSEEYDNG